MLMILGLLLVPKMMRAQADSLELGYREYLAYVKNYHPVARQAGLLLDAAEAELLRSRGGFDPKLEVDLERKEFKGTEYYDRLNATFKIPTWFGIELKGQFEQNEGDFINPAESLPSDGLYSAGVSVDVGRGLWINERMATLRKARYFMEQSLADQELLLNDILFEASRAYFNWVRAHRDLDVYSEFLENARRRYDGIVRSAAAGDLAAIDTVEAGIALRNRELGLEQARLASLKASLEVSNYLWLDGNLPLEIREGVRPESEPEPSVQQTLGLLGWDPDSLDLEMHPKMRSLENKIRSLEVDQRLKANQLLPQISLEYNFLTEAPRELGTYETQNFKGGLTFRMPLFLRKERGALKLARVKVAEAGLERLNAQLSLRNKVQSLFNESRSLGVQFSLGETIAGDYQRLLEAEERKFGFGESSLFLVNTRESRLIDARLKVNELQNKRLDAQAELFQVLAIIPELATDMEAANGI